ncbi:hypothetical protein EVAR_95100_1 [Eumeta japonica]|uniref:Uncharacterized protein n=1 Tax=Eumeta variegata TaxID=151549 RepID=A0A4C1W5M6_EUMVA|nr:hypothetical protein EVAR_95100_1 [Eumeta japonica]
MTRRRTSAGRASGAAVPRDDAPRPPYLYCDYPATHGRTLENASRRRRPPSNRLRPLPGRITIFRFNRPVALSIQLRGRNPENAIISAEAQLTSPTSSRRRYDILRLRAGFQLERDAVGGGGIEAKPAVPAP